MAYCVLAKELGIWLVVESNINLLYAECVAKYYKNRGIQVQIKEMK